LRNKKANIIAVIVPRLSKGPCAEFLSEIQELACVKGFGVIVLQSLESVIKEIECINNTSDGSVEGIIILRTKFMRTPSFYKNVQVLESNGIPFGIVHYETINSTGTAYLSGIGKKVFSWLISQINNKIDLKSG
tara:strand:- start:80 stop:481 length:402 start_codon:yes stop_codon:yes gene_type:complete